MAPRPQGKSPDRPAVMPLRERISLSDEVYAALRSALLSGAFGPGAQLHESEIAVQLGVSKTPVREAISTLRAKGLVTSGTTRGTVVAELDDEVVCQLYETRMLLEPEAVRQATWLADAMLISRARRLLAASEQYGKSQDFNALSCSNRDFHELLYERCRNQIMRTMLNDMRDQVQLVAANQWRRTSPTWELERAEHLAILGAVEARDAELAACLSREHLERAVVRVQNHDVRDDGQQRS